MRNAQQFILGLISIGLSLHAAIPNAWADEAVQHKIGIIASLTGIAANYGTSVVEGAQLALKEHNRAHPARQITLIIEDDRSDPKSAVTAYQKLRSVDRIDGLIGATWWANTIVKIAEKDGLPFISCETLYNKEFVRAPNYFSIFGDLRDWIRVFDPVLRKAQLKRAAMVRFTSGFADTLESEMRLLFASAPREFLEALVYSDIEMSEAASFALKIKSLKPEVVYVDGQPASLAAFLRRASEAKLDSVTFLTNEIFDDAVRQKLIDISGLKFPVYFTKRQAFDKDFAELFQNEYSKVPYLQADLGYLAVRLLDSARSSGDPIRHLKGGTAEVDGKKIQFDQNNVFTGIVQEVWVARNGTIEKAGEE